MKKIYEKNKIIIQGTLVSLGGIGLFEWVISPGLTVANTIVNMFSVLLSVVVLFVIGVFFWENLIKNNKKEETWKELEMNGKKILTEENKNEKKETDNIN